MLDVTSRRAIRGEDGDAQVITGEQSGEIGRAPNIAAAGRIAALDDLLGRHERRSHRADRARASQRAWPAHVVDAVEVGRREVDGAATTQRDSEAPHSGVKRGAFFS